MIPSDVGDMRDDMVAAGLNEETALELAWKFYNAMLEHPDTTGATPIHKVAL